MNPNEPDAREGRPLGITALGCFFAFGTLASGLSALSLLFCRRATRTYVAALAYHATHAAAWRLEPFMWRLAHSGPGVLDNQRSRQATDQDGTY